MECHRALFATLTEIQNSTKRMDDERFEMEESVLVNGVSSPTRRREEEKLGHLLLALESLLGERLMEKAMTVAKTGGAIEEFRSVKSNRVCYHVRGETGNRYLVLDTNFCQCHYFITRLHSPLGEIPICKHVVAVYLARAQGNNVVRRTVAEEDWSSFLEVARNTE